MSRAAILMGLVGFGVVRTRPEVPPDGDAVDDAYAATVTRREESFIVRNHLAATSRVSIETTVRRPAGRHHGELVLYYDSYTRIQNLKGEILDSEGRVVQRLKKEHLEDVSAVPWESLYEEGRYRIARMYHSDFPYTVRYDYELQHSNLLNWPTWYAGEEDIPTLYTRFQVVSPTSLEVRFALRGIEKQPAVDTLDHRQILTWEFREVLPFVPEPWGPSWSQQQPAVLLAPSFFEVEDIPGELTSWAGLATWYGSLFADRQHVPERARADVEELAASTDDPRQRAKLIYEYVQNRTRYVSVQLGLGQWQPDGVEAVHRRGYGDCKALTNYTLALLRVAGVQAQPALVKSGVSEPDILTDFPCNQYNHVILYLPMDPESIWLECTSQSAPFGHIGAANENRFALVVESNGGRLIKTPASPAHRNRRIRTVSVDVRGDLNATAHAVSVFTGNRADAARTHLGGDGPSWRENLVDFLQIPGFEVRSATRRNDGFRSDTVAIEVELDLPHLATRAGTRVFLTPNVMGSWTAVPPAMVQRTQPVVFSHAFLDEDSVRITLPTNYEVETLPKRVALSTKFGRFHASATRDSTGVITYTRTLHVGQPRIAPEQYDEVVDFFAAVARADTRQIVFKRAH